MQANDRVVTLQLVLQLILERSLDLINLIVTRNFFFLGNSS